jgi:hypothetical protein
MPPLRLATPPIDDKDTKSSKEESELRQCHLWNEEGSIGVAIVNPILHEILCIRPGIFGPTTTNAWKASAAAISETAGWLSQMRSSGTEKTRLFRRNADGDT